MHVELHAQCPSFLSDLMKLEVSRLIFKNAQINFFLIRPVGAELIHADGGTKGQTDTAKLIFAFRCSVYACKKNQYLSAKHSCVPKSLQSSCMYAFK